MAKDYKELYDKEVAKNRELEKKMEELVEKLSNMTDNAMAMFADRGNQVNINQSLQVENDAMKKEIAFLKKHVLANSYYQKIAEGFVGLANISVPEDVNDIVPDPTDEQVADMMRQMQEEIKPE